MQRRIQGSVAEADGADAGPERHQEGYEEDPPDHEESFKELWMPLMEAIVIKTGHMFTVCAAPERRKVLIDEFSTSTTSVRGRSWRS